MAVSCYFNPMEQIATCLGHRQGGLQKKTYYSVAVSNLIFLPIFFHEIFWFTFNFVGKTLKPVLSWPGLCGSRSETKFVSSPLAKLPLVWVSFDPIGKTGESRKTVSMDSTH